MVKGTNLPERFIFRQVHYADLPTFLADGEIRAKNHATLQRCHQVSYEEIVDRRGTNEFSVPNGGVVNDYVPFYFSPITAFTYTISRENVPLVSPDGAYLRQACEDDRIFMVASPEHFRGSGLLTCFSDYALNSRAPMPTVETDLDKLEDHVHWDVFDEGPLTAKIPEIGYDGVCSYFLNKASPPERMTRREKRMAEFLVHEAVPLDKVVCIIAKSDTMKDTLKTMMEASTWDIPVYSKRGCYYR